LRKVSLQDLERRITVQAAAGHALFNVSRLERATANDSDRLRKYLQRFGLTWADIMEAT